MISLKKLGRNMDAIRPFIKRYGGIFNDLTLGTRFMWADEFDIDYAVFNDTLIMRENFRGRVSFYYPLGEDVTGALCEIENLCKASGENAISFGCLTAAQAEKISERYAGAKVNALRDWADYIYPAEQFKTYAGKKLSGQRNHVNKFKKLYPEYRTHFIEKADLSRITEFLKEFENENELTGLAAEELPKVGVLLNNMDYLDQFGIFLTVGDKIVSLSVGEIVGETLFVHVEKGLKEFEGVYPVTAQEFARAFATDGVKFINREEDCGDLGLRVSKTQYHPSEIRMKNYVSAKNSFALITPPVCFATERLAVTEIREEDKSRYAELYTDEEINRFYGYDYRQDIGNNAPDGDYFFGFMQNLKEKREEYSLAVRLCGKMIGEIVFYNFGYCGEAEIGFRFIKEYQGKGYAAESVKRAIDFAFNAGFNKIECRHFKENARSEKLILKLGFAFTREDKTHKYYELKK